MFSVTRKRKMALFKFLTQLQSRSCHTLFSSPSDIVSLFCLVLFQRLRFFISLDAHSASKSCRFVCVAFFRKDKLRRFYIFKGKIILNFSIYVNKSYLWQKLLSISTKNTFTTWKFWYNMTSKILMERSKVKVSEEGKQLGFEVQCEKGEDWGWEGERRWLRCRTILLKISQG